MHASLREAGNGRMEGNNKGSTAIWYPEASSSVIDPPVSMFLAYFKAEKERVASVDITRARGEKGKEKPLFSSTVCDLLSQEIFNLYKVKACKCFSFTRF